MYDAAHFYANYFTMVQLGKIHIPWGRSAKIQKCAPALNAKLDDLYRAFPQMLKGPDFWTIFFKSIKSSVYTTRAI
jgi:hypothetical protein